VNTFAFIIHPIDPKRDVSRKFPFLGRVLSAGQIDFFSAFFPPVYLSEIEGVTSAGTGETLRGWFIACPLTPARMLALPERMVYRKIIQTGRMAERLGAQLLGLGAFTSVVGDGGLTVARALDIPVTTGDSYTIAIAVQSLREAARLLDIPLENARAAVLGATGAIGRVCAQLLAGEAGELLLIGRDAAALKQQSGALSAAGARADLVTATDLSALRTADVVLTVTSSLQALVQPGHLKPGSVICDVARPRDVSAQVAAYREDVLVIDGGMVSVPGNVNFNFDFGFPAGKAYACMAETMALALEGRLESFTLGKAISLAQVQEIAAIADRHGFRLSGFRSFEKAVTPDQIETVRTQSRSTRILA
jgi:predicted amino acid dehydrogenase